MFNTILLPIDGSALSFKPVQVAIDLARLSASKVIVLSVAEPRLFRGSDRDSLQSGRAVESENLSSAQQNVLKVRAAAEQAGVACDSLVSMSADAREEILRTVEAANCDLIVMATRGKMGVLDTIFSESTAQEVIRKSPVPVMVFP